MEEEGRRGKEGEQRRWKEKEGRIEDREGMEQEGRKKGHC